MLHVIHTLDDPFIHLLSGDPVRPAIPWHNRVGPLSKVLVLLNTQEQPQSVVCVTFGEQVPEDEDHLFAYQGQAPTVAVLYTIWSLSMGGGRAMIDEAMQYITSQWPSVQQIVTLSPPTEMARRFHLRNGARELRVNPTTVNFIYSAA